jgi:hypothetical protein
MNHNKLPTNMNKVSTYTLIGKALGVKEGNQISNSSIDIWKLNKLLNLLSKFHLSSPDPDLFVSF